MLGGEVTGTQPNLRGAVQISVNFDHMNLLIREARPGEEPSDTAALQTFGPAEFDADTKMGPFVSHNEWGTDHFGFRVHEDLQTFCEKVRGRGGEFSVEP